MFDDVPAARRNNMAAIRSKNTRPELILRKGLHARGLRFRLHAKDLPGSPDLVFPSRQAVIFVNGCFWHSHSCKWGQVVPKTRAQFWADKRARTVERDVQALRSLSDQGWRSFVVWECDLRLNADRTIETSADWLGVQSA
nr:very short patch repair endonuclease [Agreia sp. Leaf283]